jgi:3-dehydroquinate dehydratase-2
MAFSGRQQHRRTQPKPAPLQRVHVDAPDHDIAPDQPRIERIKTEISGDIRQMLRRYQGHLPGAAVPVVPAQPVVRVHLGPRDRNQGLAPFRPQPDPHHHTRPYRRGQQAGEGRLRVQQDVVSVRRLKQRKRRMTRLVYVLNGPNLNLLGKRQPHIYGHETLADVERDCRALAIELGLTLRFHQSNREYEIIDWIHEAREVAGGIVINPAAFTHTSVAILDALNTFDASVIEIHISNVHKREEFRHKSFVSLRADGVIAGFGTQGYQLALRRVASLIDQAKA